MNYLKVLVRAAWILVVMTTSANAHTTYRLDAGPVCMAPGPVGSRSQAGDPAAPSSDPMGLPKGMSSPAPFKWDGVLGPRVLRVTDPWDASANRALA
jgi:hypothetical protein